MIQRPLHVEIGDWVRFQKDGHLVIGVVQYLQRSCIGTLYAYTTEHGSVEVEYILERRSAPEGGTK